MGARRSSPYLVCHEGRDGSSNLVILWRSTAGPQENEQEPGSKKQASDVIRKVHTREKI